MPCFVSHEHQTSCELLHLVPTFVQKFWMSNQARQVYVVPLRLVWTTKEIHPFTLVENSQFSSKIRSPVKKLTSFFLSVLPWSFSKKFSNRGRWVLLGQTSSLSDSGQDLTYLQRGLQDKFWVSSTQWSQFCPPLKASYIVVIDFMDNYISLESIFFHGYFSCHSIFQWSNLDWWENDRTNGLLF